MGQSRQSRPPSGPARRHHARAHAAPGSCADRASRRRAVRPTDRGNDASAVAHHWPPISDWPATPSPTRTPNSSRRAGWRHAKGQAPGSSTPARRPAPASPRGAASRVPTHNLHPGSPRCRGVPAQRMGGSHAPRTHQRTRPRRCAWAIRGAGPSCATRSPITWRACAACGHRRTRSSSARACARRCELLGRVFEHPAARSRSRRTGSSSSATPSPPWECRPSRSDVDDHGAVVSELDELDVPAVLLTPAHHNPCGMPLHPSRRTAVVEWAQRTDGYVMDDDYDGEFRYDRQPSARSRH